MSASCLHGILHDTKEEELFMLKVQNLSMSARETLLEDMNTEFESGVVYGIVATNGSGKTTLLRILAGLTKAQSGAVYLEDSSGKIDLVTTRKKDFLL